MILYRITTSNDSFLSKLWEEGWILSCISEGKMYFWKEEKRTRKQSLQVAWDDFQDFYHLYPHKKGKENARVMWSRLTEKERELAHAWLIRYIAYWKQKAIEKQFLPHPATWLHQKRWEDDLSDNVILTKPIENLQKEIKEDKQNEAEKKWMSEQLAKLKANWKWDEWYDQAKNELPEWQRQYEALIITRMKMRINKPWQWNNI